MRLRQITLVCDKIGVEWPRVISEGVRREESSVLGYQKVQECDQKGSRAKK